MFRSLVPSSALQLSTYSDLDAFRPAELVEDARSIPLDVAHFYAARAVFCLPGCRIILMRSFARILDAAYRTPGGMLILSMNDDVEARATGMSLDSRFLLSLRGVADCQFVEPRSNLYALIIFSPRLPDRDWFDTADAIEAVEANPAGLMHARHLVANILRTASAEPGLFDSPGVAEHLQDGLLLALDDLVLNAGVSETRDRFATARLSRLVKLLDAHVAANPAALLDSASLAREFGVSVRTLGNAVSRIRGMSLHQYIRLKRLWATRARLLRGGAGANVTASARAHGFHHMGEFAGMYRAAFNEAPSETLARGRRGVA